MEPLTKIRCSSLPLATICPGSVRAAEVQIDPVSEAAGVGTACHLGLAKLVRGQSPQIALQATTEELPKVDADELRPLFWAGVRAWKQIAEWFDNPQCEADFEHGALTGHVDVCDGNTQRKTVALVDWKSGRVDANYRDQLFGYAWLLMQDDRSIDAVSASAVWLRTGEVESYTVSRARSEEWYSAMVAIVINWDGTFHPGAHCVHCPRNHDCPAQTALVRRDVAMFSDGVATDLQTMPGPEFVGLHLKLKGLASRIEGALKSMRGEVERRGGTVDAGDGTVLHFRKEGGKRQVDTFKAWPILTAQFDDEELCKGLTVSVLTLEKIVGDKAEKGKGKAKEAFCAALEDAGALTQPTIKKLVHERKKD